MPKKRLSAEDDNMRDMMETASLYLYKKSEFASALCEPVTNIVKNIHKKSKYETTHWPMKFYQWEWRRINTNASIGNIETCEQNIAEVKKKLNDGMELKRTLKMNWNAFYAKTLIWKTVLIKYVRYHVLKNRRFKNVDFMLQYMLVTW